LQLADDGHQFRRAAWPVERPGLRARIDFVAWPALARDPRAIAAALAHSLSDFAPHVLGLLAQPGGLQVFGGGNEMSQLALMVAIARAGTIAVTPLSFGARPITFAFFALWSRPIAIALFGLRPRAVTVTPFTFRAWSVAVAPLAFRAGAIAISFFSFAAWSVAVSLLVAPRLGGRRG
jgi:hypothetical protein